MFEVPFRYNTNGINMEWCSWSRARIRVYHGIPPLDGRIPSKKIIKKIQVSQHLQIQISQIKNLSSPAETKGGRCTSAQCQDGPCYPCSGYETRILVGRWLESIQNWCLSHLWLGDTRCINLDAHPSTGLCRRGRTVLLLVILCLTTTILLCWNQVQQSRDMVLAFRVYICATLMQNVTSISQTISKLAKPKVWKPRRLSKITQAAPGFKFKSSLL